MVNEFDNHKKQIIELKVMEGFNTLYYYWD